MVRAHARGRGRAFHCRHRARASVIDPRRGSPRGNVGAAGTHRSALVRFAAFAARRLRAAVLCGDRPAGRGRRGGPADRRSSRRSVEGRSRAGAGPCRPFVSVAAWLVRGSDGIPSRAKICALCRRGPGERRLPPAQRRDSGCAGDAPAGKLAGIGSDGHRPRSCRFRQAPAVAGGTVGVRRHLDP